MFINFLSYKLEQKGGVLIEIGRFFPSSRMCCNCGHTNKELELKDREWTCLNCNTHHHRDETAAINIRNEGIRIIGAGSAPHGDDVRLGIYLKQLSVK